MKKIEIEIPDGKEAKWVDGVLTLVDEKPIEYKFKVGDKVTFKGSIRTVTNRFIIEKSCPIYRLDDYLNIREDKLELYVPQDITDRIKTFGDACLWCNKNGKKSLVDDFNEWQCVDKDVEDIIAYLKLRIITAALNEGWEPTEEDFRNVSYYSERSGQIYTCKIDDYYCDASTKLCFKSEDLALYAAKQFRDIYADFCGCKKGGEA